MSAVVDNGRQLDAEATPGPWHIVGPPWNEGAPWVNAGSEDPHDRHFVCDTVNMVEQECEEQPNAEADAALIVWARNHLAALLDVAAAADHVLAHGQLGKQSGRRLREALARLGQHE